MSSLPVKDLIAFCLLALGVLLIVTLVGRYALAAIRAPKRLRVIGPSIGLALIIALAWPLQMMGVSMRTLSVALVALTVVGVVLPFCGPRFSGLCWTVTDFSRGDLLALAVALVATAAFLEPALRDHGLTLASLGNADPVSYSLDARATLDSGYAPSPGVLNRDLNLDAAWNWPGAVTVQALVSGVTGRPPGLTLLLTLGFVVSLGQWQASALVRRLVPASSRGARWAVALAAPLVAAIAWLNPFGGYLIGSGFLAQLTAMALFPALLIVLLARGAVHGRGVWPAAIAGGILAGAATATFAAVAPVAIILVLVAALIVTRIRDGALPWSSMWRPGIVAGMVALLSALGGLLWFSYNGVLITTSSSAGWPMAPPSIPTMFGITPFLEQSGVSTGFGIAGWVGIAIVVLALIGDLATRDELRGWRLAIGTTALALMGAAAVAFGSDAYKTWKMWGFVAPLLIIAVAAVVGALCGRLRGVGARKAVPIAGVGVAVLICGLAVWRGGQDWHRSPYAFGTSMDQVMLLSNPELTRLDGLDVKGEGTVDTLMLLLYAGTRVRNAVSPSFYPALPPRFPATLMGTANAPAHPRHNQRVAPLGTAYVLVEDAP